MSTALSDYPLLKAPDTNVDAGSEHVLRWTNASDRLKHCVVYPELSIKPFVTNKIGLWRASFWSCVAIAMLFMATPNAGFTQSGSFAPPVLLSDVDFDTLADHESHPSILRCLTPLIIEFEHRGGNASKLTPQLQSLLKSHPEIAQAEFISASGRFRFHYDITGTHAVPQTDSNNSGVPDYVEFASEYADSSYNYLVLELGFVDFLTPDRPYDIYFRNFPYYGLTRTVSITDNGNTVTTTHIEVHNNFNGFPPNRDPDGQQLGSLKVTIAHEMKHAIQFATNQWRGSAGSVNWVELDATMTEEIVFPTVKDYINYLPSSNSVFRGAHNGIPGSYEQATFGLYYVERFGPGFWVDVWDEIHRSPLLNMFTAMRKVLESRGEDFSTEFTANLKWHMAAGERSRPGFGFRDRQLYPNISLSQSSSTLPYVSPMPTMRAYSARFYELAPSFISGGEVAAAIMRANSNQALAIVGFGVDASVHTILLNSPDAPTFQAVRTGWDWETIDRVGLIYVNTGASVGASAQFLAGLANDSRGIIPYGDINRDGRTNTADSDEVLTRVLQTPGPSISPQSSLLDRKILDVSDNGSITLYDAALIWRYTQSDNSPFSFPADPDGAGWFPAASTMQTMNSITSIIPPSSISQSQTASVSEIDARFHLSTSPDNDSLWVYLDLKQYALYSSVFAELRYDSSLVKLERVRLPSSDTELQSTQFFETATGARVGGIATDASINNTILELVFKPLQDTTVTIGFDAVHLDEQFSELNIPDINVRVRPKEGVSVPELTDIPIGIELLAAFPNPFNPSVTIPFQSDQPAYVEIAVFDHIGRKIQTLFASDVSTGRHQVSFNGGNLASGMYIVHMVARYHHTPGVVTSTQKITLIK